jgi:MFS family permease
VPEAATGGGELHGPALISAANLMTFRQLKSGYFVLEGLNSISTAFYFYYLFFFMQREFGFENLGNLALAALNGLIYTFMSWAAGRIGQRIGYFKALRAGFVVMSVALGIGLFTTTLLGHVLVMCAWTVGVCFTWPMLEALVSEGENSLGLQKMIGIYNLVWAGTSALAYFAGGMLLETLGLRSLFWLPLSVHLIQLAFLIWVQRAAALAPHALPVETVGATVELNPRPIARARLFLRLAWVANPFAYVAINTVAAVVPGLARQLNLSPALAGVFCSVWFFSRVATFLALWLWTGWHYRLRWFFAAYLLLVGSFGAILLVPSLGVIMVAQVTFGFAVGLIYYSSLYYSMDAGDTKGEHGGVHESAIGAGIFAGPAIGATALRLFPEHPNSGAWAVSLALCGGLVGLVFLIRRRGRGS